MHKHPNVTPSPDRPPSNPTTPHLNILRLVLAAKHLQIAEATLRDLRFYSADRLAANGTKIPGNGFAKAFLKLGRAVYVDIPVFVEIWRSQSEGGRHD